MRNSPTRFAMDKEILLHLLTEVVAKEDEVTNGASLILSCPFTATRSSIELLKLCSLNKKSLNSSFASQLQVFLWNSSKIWKGLLYATVKSSFKIERNWQSCHQSNHGQITGNPGRLLLAHSGKLQAYSRNLSHGAVNTKRQWNLTHLRPRRRWVHSLPVGRLPLIFIYLVGWGLAHHHQISCSGYRATVPRTCSLEFWHLLAPKSLLPCLKRIDSGKILFLRKRHGKRSVQSCTRYVWKYVDAWKTMNAKLPFVLT